MEVHRKRPRGFLSEPPEPRICFSPAPAVPTPRPVGPAPALEGRRPRTESSALTASGRGPHATLGSFVHACSFQSAHILIASRLRTKAAALAVWARRSSRHHSCFSAAASGGPPRGGGAARRSSRPALAQRPACSASMSPQLSVFPRNSEIKDGLLRSIFSATVEYRF
jgi:hypothetical protein